MKKQLIVSTLAATAAATALFPAPEAQAAEWIIKEDSAEKRPWNVGVLLGLPLGYGSFGLAPIGILDIPIVDKGFVPINDSFDIEVGLNTILFLDPFAVGVTPFAGARWNFHLQKKWDAYAALRLGAYINNGAAFHFSTLVGTTYKFNETWGIRGEVGGGYGGAGISAGVNIAF